MKLTKGILVLAFASATLGGCVGVHTFDNRSMSDVDREARRVLQEDGYEILNKQEFAASAKGFEAVITHVAEKDGTLYKTEVTCRNTCYVSNTQALRAAPAPAKTGK